MIIDNRVIRCTTKEYHKISMREQSEAELIIIDDEKLGTLVIKDRYGKCSTISKEDYNRIFFNEESKSQ